MTAIVAVMTILTISGIWFATSRHRVRVWLAHAYTATVFASNAAMAWAWAADLWLVWAAMAWCIAAAIVGIRARRQRRPPIGALPMAKVVLKEQVR